ncbi:VOC family protein [Demequina soli]|uniref:VOC family protein n=1 Tax=Demequina soli TaxID=1638987 RepID=UPI0007809317|nr:VOC family protein [Demequina soli]
MNISVVSIPVSDQQRAKAYYVDVLGFTVVEEAPFGGGMSWIQLAPPGSSGATVTLVTWFDAMPAGGLRGLVIDTDDIDAAYEDLLARGADLGGPPSRMAGGIFVMVTDPDGNQFALHQEGSR